MFTHVINAKGRQVMRFEDVIFIKHSLRLELHKLFKWKCGTDIRAACKLVYDR